jgi:hypothetical protein
VAFYWLPRCHQRRLSFFSLDETVERHIFAMIKRRRVTISIPRNSPALQAEVEKALREKYSSVEFTFIEGEIDSSCRIVTTDPEDPPLWESIQLDLARTERQFLTSG